MSGPRLLLLLALLAAIGVPAGVLSARCANGSCGEGVERASPVPFCPLPAGLRGLLENGYREGRSPDVLGVANATPVTSIADGGRTAWPGIGTTSSGRVPLVYWGTGISRAELPDEVGLDSIAPTVSEIIGFERPFARVRSGTPTPGVANGERPRLVLMIAWKGVGAAELDAAGARDRPFLTSLLQDGASTLRADAGSTPLDPAATLTTIGTGGLPSQHGVTGSFVRNDEGRVVPAFGPDAPDTVIATLADDLDHDEPATLVGAVLSDSLDRGIVGGGWYRGGDAVDAVVGSGATAPNAVAERLATGYGDDEVTDILAVVLNGDVRSLDRWTRRIVSDAERSTNDRALVVVSGTGSRAASATALSDDALVAAVEDAFPGEDPAVEIAVPGGLFLDQDALAREHVTGLLAVEAMRSVQSTGGRPILSDAFQGFAISFGRYC